jgi:hypothetical protein
MNIPTVISILLLMISFHSNSQVSGVGKNRNSPGGKLTGTVYYTPPSGNSEIFIEKDWMPGSILLTDGDLFEGEWVNYYMMGDELVVFNGDLKQLVTIDKEKVKEFSMDVPEGTRRFIKVGESARSRYYEQVYKGTYSLLIFHYIFIQKNKPYHDESGNLKHTRLLKRSHFYMYSHDDGSLHFLQKNHRALIQQLSGSKKEMRRVLRKSRLQGSKEEKLIKAFQVLDEAGLMKK